MAKTRYAGAAWNAGNRDETPPLPAWVQRAGRALANHKENFLGFLTAVVVVHLAGRADPVSAVAAVVYVVSRIAHAGFYISGVTGFRSIAHVISLIATLTIFSRLL